MIEQPLISVIIPCFNCRYTVAEAIESALAQTYHNKEVIVIDDGSTDGSLEVIRSFGDAICWETGPNRGASAARNRGIELAADPSRLRTAPDFTNLVEAQLRPGYQRRPRQAFIVPNQRMIEKTTKAEADRYVPFLATCISQLARRHCEPCLLVHDTGSDHEVIAQIQEAVGGPLPVVEESDPRLLKGILGTAWIVIGSRYHALVSALSQTVPCLASGWSHKYQALLEDYGCPDCLLPVSSSEEQISQALDRLTDGSGRADAMARLSLAAKDQETRAQRMWAEVDAALAIAAGK